MACIWQGIWRLQQVREGILADQWSDDRTGAGLWVWGGNGGGQLGQNDLTHRSSPVQVPGTTWCFAVGGGCLIAAIKNDNTFWVWGSNTLGQFGNNNSTHRSSPIQVPGTTWCSITAGGEGTQEFYNMYAIKTDCTLWSWGYNSAGQLAQNDRTCRSSPIQIPGINWWSRPTINITPSSLSLSAKALKTDCTLYTWGYNAYGDLGQNDVAHRSSPVQVPGTNWCFVLSGSYSIAALKTDNTLYTWGLNDAGQLGQNDRASRSSPTQIPGITWCSLQTSAKYATGACERDAFYGLKTDGTLWSWGSGRSGELGQNSITHRSSPVQIPGTTWCKLFCHHGTYHIGAFKTDCTLWTWGNNYQGELGLNVNLAGYSSPVQLPGTNWTGASGGGNHGLGLKFPYL